MDDERRRFNEDQDRQWERQERLEDSAELDEYRRSEYEHRQAVKKERAARLAKRMGFRA